MTPLDTSNQELDQPVEKDLSELPQITLVGGAIKNAMQRVKASKRDLYFVPLEEIQVLPDFNIRNDTPSLQEHIRFLADSMKADGFRATHPLSGYIQHKDGKEVVCLVDGHCRLAAAKIAKAEGAEIGSIPMICASQSHDIVDLTVALFTSSTSKPLEPLELGALCKRFLKYHLTEKEVADRLHVSIQYVRDLLKLVSAPQEIRSMVSSGQIAASTATAILTQHGDKSVEVIKEGLKVAESKGKTKLTKASLVDVKTKFVKKSAPAIYDLVQVMREDPSYEQIGEELRSKLDEILRQIDNAAQKAANRAERAAQVHDGQGDSKTDLSDKNQAATVD